MLVGLVGLVGAGGAWAQPAFVSGFGSYGSGNGQFIAPFGVAVAGDGSVLVADTSTGRVQRFALDGTYLDQFGSVGGGSSQFRGPLGMAAAGDGSVLVADSVNNRVQRFSLTGTYLSQFGSYGSGSGQLDSPTGVAVAGDGSVLVADRDNSRVERFAADGTYVAQFGSYGSGNGQFDWPYGVAVAGDGSVLVTDMNNNRVQHFSQNGTYLSQFGGRFGSGDGQFRGPAQVAVAGDGSVLVTDINNHRVQRFAADGTYLEQFGSLGSGNGQLYSPWGVAVAGDGSLLVVDSGNKRVQRFGDFDATLASPGFGTVAVGANATQTLALTNSGLTDLPLDAITISGPDAGQFALTGGTCTSSTTLADGQACTIQLTATPTQTGALSATLAVRATMGAWSDTYTAPLAASAVPLPTPVPTAPTVVLAAPSISELSPASGPTTGAQQVTITGTNFTDSTEVWFGDTPATGVQVERYDRLTVQTPTHVAGPVVMTVRTPAGTSPPFTYTYLANDPAASGTGNATPPPGITTGCIVPDLHGRTIPAARQRLQAAGCRLGHVRRTGSRHGAATPRVIGQTPAATTQQPPGTHVTITTRVHR